MTCSKLEVRGTDAGSVALVYYPDSGRYELQLTDTAGNLRAVPVAAYAALDAFHSPEPYVEAAWPLAR